jgi:uncharacterized alkaline shock family protein YloU
MSTDAKDTGARKSGNMSSVPGATTIEDQVVAAVAGYVAEQVDGVTRIGPGGVLRVLSGVAQDTASQAATGVDVEAGEKEAIFDLDVYIEYGYSVPKIAGEIRQKVGSEVKSQLGLTAKEINISIAGIEFPDREEPRVE